MIIQKSTRRIMIQAIPKYFLGYVGIVLMLLMATSLQAQGTYAISGVVRSAADNSVLPGVNVIIAGTTTGVITDFNGNYAIEVKPGDKLLFSFIGFQSQEVIITDQKTLDIALVDEVSDLDEVVVVGYGTQKKSDITGSVTSVSADRLENIPVTNVMQAVQGSVSGVNVTQVSSIPGEEPTVLVRGGGSLTASTTPYVVVDGVPITKMGGTMNDINPNDIKSIEVLKDASAVAIYGMNGANGVILVTTKKGKSDVPRIRYSGYIGIDDFSHIPDLCSPEELLARYAEGSRINGSALYASPVKYEYEVENYENNHIIDWIDAISQTGIQQNHNVSISGGNDKTNYYISADYMDQKGIIQGYNYKRYSIRTNIDAQVTDYLKLGTNTSIIHHNRDGGRANLLNAEAMSPYGRMYEEDGSYTIYPMYSQTLWSNPLLPTTTDPERRQYNINVNGFADLDFGKIYDKLKGLSYEVNAGFSYKPIKNCYYDGESVNDQLGTATIYHYETEAYTIENILKYARDINKNHFDLTAVYSAQQRKYTSSEAQAEDFVNDELEWNRLQAGASSYVESYADRYAANSQMGRLNYSYDSRYLFTATVRRDGSSVFAENKKYGVFPSVALGWNISRENFLENLDAINNLKLRLSYGTSGNEAVDPYSTFSTTSDVQIALGGSTNIAMVADALGNTDLSWEKKQSLNIGVDFGFLNNRINGTIDYYKSKNTDLLLERNLPAASGFSSVYANIGETKGSGLEITLNTVNIVRNDFRWSSTIVFSANKSEIVELYGDGEDDSGNGWYLGEPLDAIRDYDQVGIWQEDEIENGDQDSWDPVADAGDLKLADRDNSGEIDDSDRHIIGQKSPKWTGGLTNTLTFKNLSLNVFLQTVQGAMKSNAHIGMASDELQSRNSLSEIGYWTPENKSNKWRSLSTDSNPHSYGFYYKNNYTRIKDVTLNYNFSKNLTEKIGVDNLSVYVSGRNLYTFTNWIGWDPEERDILRGSDKWDINYPSVKTIVFGVNLTL